MEEDEFEGMIDQAEEAQETLSTLIEEAENADKDSDHGIAAARFRAAMEMSSGNAYLRQQTALHTYKSEQPSKVLALMEAKHILAPLNPDNSNDPETLGLSGAIHKRLWEQTEDRAALDLAIQYYRKGYDLRGDYYNGENAALCLKQRGILQENAQESFYDRLSAVKIHRDIIRSLLKMVSGEDFEERSDQEWVFATLANSLFALSRPEEAEKFELKFLELCSADWKKETYYAGKKSLFDLYELDYPEE